MVVRGVGHGRLRLESVAMVVGGLHESLTDKNNTLIRVVIRLDFYVIYRGCTSASWCSLAVQLFFEF